MSLLTQNSDLKMGGIFGWTLPAHVVKFKDGTRFNVCPNAGVCAGLCYAKQGTYMFSNVRRAHVKNLLLVLNHREIWVNRMIRELSKKKYRGRHIRVHDSGDFFNEGYLLDWYWIMRQAPNVLFYAYTKEVAMIKKHRDKQPANFTTIFSFGGRQDALIDRKVDRHSDVFGDYEAMIQAGYFPMGDDDRQAAINPNHRIGLYRNNIPQFIKKIGKHTFSDMQLGAR